MKTFNFFIFFVLLAMYGQANGNDGKYLEAMQKNIKTIYEAKDISQFQQAVNSFERIATVEKNRWEPLYYIAYGNIMMANFEKDSNKKDSYLDRAMTVVNQAKAISPQESEILALEGFAYMIRVSVDPQSRGMSYAPQAMQAFNTALAFNPENPRALGLLAQMQFGTAQFFKSPITEACTLNSKASEKIQTYKSENPLAPVWGAGMIESLKEKCK
jgi:tetratricopeptide (TPR) repeat protein